jgi:hypothetical protein
MRSLAVSLTDIFKVYLNLKSLNLLSKAAKYANCVSSKFIAKNTTAEITAYGK